MAPWGHMYVNPGLTEPLNNPVLNSRWPFEEYKLDLSELLEYLRAFITDDRKIIHGNSELKRLI